jgi:amidase
MFVADGGKSVRALLEPTEEPFRPEMKQYEQASELGTYDLWKLQAERSELQRQFLSQWMSYDGLDAILCKLRFGHMSSHLKLTSVGPTTPYTSVVHGGFKYVGYTGVFNVVDYSAVSFPTGVTADKKKDKIPAEYAPLGDLCKEIQTDCMFRSR